MKTKLRDLSGRFVAEFFIVIIGILVALQLEDWRLDRAALEVETTQLSAIRTDLLDNRARLDTVMALQARAVTAGESVLEMHAGIVAPLRPIRGNRGFVAQASDRPGEE